MQSHSYFDSKPLLSSANSLQKNSHEHDGALSFLPSDQPACDDLHDTTNRVHWNLIRTLSTVTPQILHFSFPSAKFRGFELLHCRLVQLFSLSQVLQVFSPQNLAYFRLEFLQFCLHICFDFCNFVSVFV